MKTFIAALVFILFSTTNLLAQCSMCTKTAADLDVKAAEDINTAIIYLAFIPLILIGVVGLLWWKHYRKPTTV